jgi:predicted RNA-binding Zn-ribbon protein involved in translation (DUF1610 family)
MDRYPRAAVTGAAVLVALLAAVSSRGQASYEASLRELSPDDPLGYFELGEEVADTASTVEQMDLARRLFCLAFILADPDHADGWLRPSACLALAALEPGAERARWLRAVATRLDRRYAAVRWDGRGEREGDSVLRLKLAEFVGLVRSGDGSLARERFEFPGVAELASSYRDAAPDDRQPSSFTRLASEAKIWPCPQCGNARVVPDPANPREGKAYCPTCRGDPGPVLTMAQLAASIALEAVILRADSQTWSAEHAMRRTQVLRDPDPAEVPLLYGVDTDLTVYRDGRWARPL